LCINQDKINGIINSSGTNAKLLCPRKVSKKLKTNILFISIPDTHNFTDKRPHERPFIFRTLMASVYCMYRPKIAEISLSQDGDPRLVNIFQ